jgi:hypothetical protein
MFIVYPFQRERGRFDNTTRFVGFHPALGQGLRATAGLTFFLSDFHLLELIAESA